MNRNNIWIHVGIAVVLITMAAVLGQIGRWQSALREHANDRFDRVENLRPSVRSGKNGSPEVLVRFKPGVNLESIRQIAFANHDQLTDEIESVSGLSIIDDLDNADPQSVADQYLAMTDTVAYAEPNYKIKLDDPIQKEILNDGVARDPGVSHPNDPQFRDQWALNNFGQDGGKQRADIDALQAWTKTKGSDDIVVAVRAQSQQHGARHRRPSSQTMPAAK